MTLDLNRIDTSALDGLSEAERKAALSMLAEISKTGRSKALEEMEYADYEEIPVDIGTFLTDPEYLGRGLTNEEGKFTVFPYWVKTLKRLFPTNVDTAYNTLILTGGIGLGKSLCAVLCELYLLYRMMCLKDPYMHYGLQPIDKITFSLMNITIDAAKGVAWDKMQQLLQSSDWFMRRGTMKGTSSKYWAPPKGIELIVGSRNNHILGRAVFCLDGDTEVLTTDGVAKIRDLVGREFRPISIDGEGNWVEGDSCSAQPTGKTDVEYELELEDGSIIKCTPNHRFMLKDGSYKEAKDLSEDDELFGFNVAHDKSIRRITRHILPEEKQFYDVVDASPWHNFLIKTNSGYVVSHNCNFTDEVNFDSMTDDVDKKKKKQLRLITQVDARMQSRFMKGTRLPTLNIIASSKDQEHAFLESYIELKKKNESKTTLIVDEPQWVIRTDKDSPEKFYVAVGNKFLASEVLPKDAPESLINSYRDKGYQMLKVPIGYYENFRDNVELALTDIAGISTVSALKYISGQRWNEAKVDSYLNPFTRDVITVGNAADDRAQYGDFFDLSRVPKDCMAKPLYVHLDLSKSGDKTGIAGVWAMGKSQSGDGNEAESMRYRVAFSVSVQAPKGYEISFDKARNFIRWLRSMGFSVKSVTSDTYQSVQILQQLKADGFKADTLSVDRLEALDGSKHRICKPYAYFKATLYEGRLQVYRKCDLLTEEIIGLEREPDGHINHPENGAFGCFVGDTKVRLVDGRSLTMRELVDEYSQGKENWVYSFNEATRRIEPKRIRKAWLTRHGAELVKVTLDNGEELLCTPDHRFMMRDGTYVEAQHLQPTDSLMPLGDARSVAKVERVGLKADVYDLEIEDNHNFALDAGVFVHNSKDQADAVVGALYDASLHVDDYAYDYGEDFDVMMGVDKDAVSESEMKKQITVDFEEALRNSRPILSSRTKEDEERERKEWEERNAGAPTEYGNMLVW